ncbi:MAG: hypothetical protein GKR98_01370 [Boseongicola sp.]|nr:MAG: hypothetical protein GKR98_01370 [Boseongicola sp.]
MKKSNKKPKQAKKQIKANQQATGAETSRRDFLRLSRNGLIGVGAVGGIGWWAVSGVRATAAEHDLSRIGRGRPAVVQVHDPQCAQCTALQRNTRRALRCYDDDDFVYLVASIKTEAGQMFASRFGVPHVTLMLFDGLGELEQVLNGVRDRDQLKPHFTTLIETV